MKMKRLAMTILLAILSLALVACGSNSTDGNAGNTNANTESANTESAANTEQANQPSTVEVTDAHGTVTVPVNPQTVVSLDNRTFETLAEWGIKLAAAPKDVMPKDVPYVNDESVQNIGNHREPNLEVIAAVNPDLVIVGQRFATFYEDIKKLVPNAAVIDLNIDVSGENGSSGDNLVNGYKDIVLTLGKIFDKNDEAQQLVARFEESLEKAKAAYNGTDTVMGVIVSGGNIGYSAPSKGRIWGPLFEIFGWVPALNDEKATSDHQGDEVSVEAIAQSNPDWLMVMDRDAAISSDGEYTPAKDVIENSPALQNTTAIKNGQIVYAPADTYTNESIQTYIEIFDALAEAFNSKK